MKYLNGFVFLSLTLISLSICAQEEKRFDFNFNIGISNADEIGTVGFPFSDGDANIRPEVSISHTRTGLFANFFATKTFTDEQVSLRGLPFTGSAIGDKVLVSLGWAGETKHLRLQTDLSLYDIEVVGESERVNSIRFLIESNRKNYAPYFAFQDYGSILAHRIGLHLRPWISVEVGGNNGIFIFPGSTNAFSRLIFRTPAIKWLADAHATFTYQKAHELPFTDRSWVSVYWNVF